MDNIQGHASQYRDVIHEDALRAGPHVKAPDNAFTLHGKRKFFFEAKKPAVNVKTDIDTAYQLHRYDWSAKMPFFILSEFEEFAIYDTRINPVKNDLLAKFARFTAPNQYSEKWDEIAEIFSKNVLTHSHSIELCLNTVSTISLASLPDFPGPMITHA